MKKKIFLALAISALLVCLFAVGVSASTDFSTVVTDDAFDATGMSTDTSARVVLGTTTIVEEEVEVTDEKTGEVTIQTVSKKVYSDCVTYPAYYIVKNSYKLSLDFEQINELFGTSYDKLSILRIEVPTNVTKIDKGIFNQCSSNVLYVDVKAEEMSLGQDSFHDCNSLIEISLPEKTTLAGYVFNSSDNLTRVNVAGDGLKTTGSEKAFSSCTKLEYINLSNTLTTYASNAFNGCSSLEITVDLSNATTINPAPFTDAVKLRF